MSLSVNCQDCGAVYRVKPELAGKKFRCQQCKSVVRIPEPELVAEFAVEELLPAPAMDLHNASSLHTAPIADPFRANAPSYPTSYLATPNEPVFPTIKAKPRKKPLAPLAASTSFILTLSGIAFLLTAIFVVTMLISFEWGMIVLVCLLVPAAIGLGITAQIGVLTTAFREDTACGICCLVMPFYYPYFIISRWRYLARYGWMIVIQSVATVVVVIVIAILAPRATPEERSSRLRAENLRILDDSLRRSGLADSLAKQSNSSVPPVTTQRRLSQAESDKLSADMKKDWNDADRRRAELEAEFEKTRREMLTRFETNPGQPVPPFPTSNNKPASPASQVRPPSRSASEVQSISKLATSADKLATKQKVFVLWGAQWWDCEIIDTTDRKKPKIHYIGWGAGYDEQVPLDRVRIPISP